MKGERYDSKQGIEGIAMLSNDPLVKTNIAAKKVEQSKNK